MRDAWTDERLDDLNERVSGGFRDLRSEINGVRAEINGVRAEVNGVRSEVAELRVEFGAMRETLGSIQGQLSVLVRTMQIGSAFLAVILAAIIGMIATQL
jgi:archaellum component FlaC